MLSNAQPLIRNEAEFKNSIIDVVKNANRVIWNWKDKPGDKIKFHISHTEIRGLVINWFNRLLKIHIGSALLHRVMRHGRPTVSLDHNTGYITSIKFSAISEYYYKDPSIIRDEIQKTLDAIDYKSFYYDPSDYVMDNLHRPGHITADTQYNSDVLISFESIKAIKFQT